MQDQQQDPLTFGQQLDTLIDAGAIGSDLADVLVELLEFAVGQGNVELANRTRVDLAELLASGWSYYEEKQDWAREDREAARWVATGGCADWRRAQARHGNVLGLPLRQRVRTRSRERRPAHRTVRSSARSGDSGDDGPSSSSPAAARRAGARGQSYIRKVSLPRWLTFLVTRLLALYGHDEHEIEFEVVVENARDLPGEATS